MKLTIMVMLLLLQVISKNILSTRLNRQLWSSDGVDFIMKVRGWAWAAL